MSTNMAFVLGAIFFVSMCVWWLFYGLDCYVNGCMGGPFIGMHLRGLMQDILWLIPYYRAKHVKDMVVHGDGPLVGCPPLFKILYCVFTKGDVDELEKQYIFRYEEIRERKNYLQVANAMLPGWGHFAVMHIMVPFGPVFLIYLIFFRENLG